MPALYWANGQYLGPAHLFAVFRTYIIFTFWKMRMRFACLLSFPCPYTVPGASQVALVVKNLPANAGDMRRGFNPWVRKIPWRRKWATHSSILAWRIPWTEEPGGLQSIGSQRVGQDWIDLALMHACLCGLVESGLWLTRPQDPLTFIIFPFAAEILSFSIFCTWIYE